MLLCFNKTLEATKQFSKSQSDMPLMGIKLTFFILEAKSVDH